MKAFHFSDFVDRKERTSRKHLELVKQMLEQSGFRIVDKMKTRNEPHLFVFNPQNNLSFDGVRVYEIGGDIAYRIQKEATTEPFGKAYPIPVEKMFEDLMGEDDMDDEQIGKEIIKSVISELKEFFEKSYDAERKGPPAQDPLGKVHMRTSGTDYANNVTSSQN